ncbi:hypothetical protein KVV02_005026 [Mortierella alpina]|uniref:Ras-GEF domain-containing protein n=1 Tax=Mortierella alpina TaxID=64518 RepID=A0A9P7ZXX3_MORAP|nr:hypothetical protein KVV02_005026 [Mortierella alpina]
MDMASYAALLQEARSQQHAGHLKGAYATYLKAHAAIVHILGTQVVFKDQATLESFPANHSQLVAHAQEILHRMKDIVDSARNHGAKATATTLSSAASASTHSGPSAERSPSATPRPKLTSSPPSQRSIATLKRTKKSIPMIPLSPLTRQSLLNSHALSLVTQRLEQAKQGSASSKSSAAGSGPRDLANLRRLIEDVRIQKAKLDAVNAQIQSVANSTITSWDPDMVARQLTIIDTGLFAKVAIPRDLVRADRKSSAAQTCIDFENYIAHSTAHLLLLEWSSSRQTSSESGPATPKSHPPHPPVNAVAHMVRVAHILIHVYRNFNSFRAVMRALTSPEVKRMHGLWSNIPSKTKDTFKRLVSIYQDQSTVTSYKEMLAQKLDAFQDVGKDAVVAIPWMRYHQDEVKSIIYSYLTGHESVGGSSDVVLSAPGARKLSAVTALLMQCRTNETTNFDRSDRDDSSAQAKRTKNREPVQVDGLKVPLTPVWDLVSLGAGDVTLHHWILTRPFLNKQQLIDESLEIEPLFHGEELPCLRTPLDNEDGEGWSSQDEDPTQDDSFEHVIAPEHDLEPLPEPTPQPLQDRRTSTYSPVAESDINDIMNELLNDDHDDGSDEGDLFGDSNTDVGTAEQRQDPLSSKTSPERSRDILQFLGIDPEDGSGSDDGEGDQRGDFGLPASNTVKGKGISSMQDDEEEIQKLMAQVRGLVRESRTHAEEVESKEVDPASGAEIEREQGRDDGILEMELPTIKPSSRFEPFQEGNEEDEFGFNFGTQQDIRATDAADTVATPDNETPKMSSLEALRRQLQAIDDAHDQASSSVNTEDTQLSGQTEDEDGQHDKDISSDKFGGGDNVLVESTQPAAAISVHTISQSSTSSSLTAHMTRIPADVLEAPPLTIGNARRRKIERDRSPHSKDYADATEEEQKEIIASTHFNTNSAPMDTSNSTREDREAEEGNSQDPEAQAAPAISIQDLDNTSLDSSPPYFGASTSTLQSPLMTAATTTTTTTTATTDVATTTTTSTSSLAANDASGPTPFTLGANLFESAEGPVVNMDEDEDTTEGVGQLLEARSEATTPSEDKSKSPGQESTAAGADFGDGMGERSPDDSTEGRGRSTRQRRRIAGGVISLGSNSKTLVSKASTSSLSNAQQEDGSPLKEDGEEEGNNEEDIVQSPADAPKNELK